MFNGKANLTKFERMWAELQTAPTFSILIVQMIHYSSIEVKNIDIHASAFCVLNNWSTPGVIK